MNREGIEKIFIPNKSQITVNFKFNLFQDAFMKYLDAPNLVLRAFPNKVVEAPPIPFYESRSLTLGLDGQH